MKLSVLMVTYNHERYIRQALDSILMQDLGDDYEIVVGEDCSTDSTRKILLEYRDRHPGKFRLLLRDPNMGAIPNFFDTLFHCSGQYVAMLEGDDYWTRPGKLRRQIEFLDAHPDYAICFHNAIGRFEDASQPDFNYVRADQPDTMDLDQLLQDNVIPTCSTVFRNGLVKSVPGWVYELKMGDYPLHIFNAQHGKIGYLNEVMGVYRIHPGGMWTGLDWIRRLQVHIQLFEHLARDLHPRYRRTARLVLARKCWQLAAQYEAQGDRRLARHYAIKSLRARPLTSSPSLQHKLKVLARVSAPATYGLASRALGAVRHSTYPSVPARPAHDSPRVSFIIPAYNAQRYLRLAIESTLAQTYESFECLIVDDGSTDRTPRILAELARRDGRVRPLRITHGGIVEALNAGLQAARGDLIARMDADDICVPDRLERQVRYLDAHPECVCVGGRVMLVDPYGSELWEMGVKPDHEGIEADLLRGHGWAMFHPTVVIRRDAMLRIGGYRAEYQWTEDMDLFLRLAQLGRLANLPDVLLRYRQHFASVNRTKLDLQMKRTMRVLAEAYQQRGRTLPPDLRVKPPDQLGRYDQLRAWCRRAIINRNFGVACQHAFAALRAEPLKYDSWSLMYHAAFRR